MVIDNDYFKKFKNVVNGLHINTSYNLCKFDFENNINK